MRLRVFLQTTHIWKKNTGPRVSPSKPSYLFSPWLSGCILLPRHRCCTHTKFTRIVFVVFVLNFYFVICFGEKSIGLWCSPPCATTKNEWHFKFSLFKSDFVRTIVRIQFAIWILLFRYFVSALFCFENSETYKCFRSEANHSAEYLILASISIHIHRYIFFLVRLCLGIWLLNIIILSLKAKLLFFYIRLKRSTCTLYTHTATQHFEQNWELLLCDWHV